jgi:hypothetical protein
MATVFSLAVIGELAEGWDDCPLAALYFSWTEGRWMTGMAIFFDGQCVGGSAVAVVVVVPWSDQFPCVCFDFTLYSQLDSFPFCADPVLLF